MTERSVLMRNVVMKGRTILRSTVVVALVFFSISCSEPLVCTEPGRLGVVAHVRDALTGRPAAYQARLIMRSDTRVDTFPDFTPSADSALATELVSLGIPGEYTVTVEKDGYSPWVRARVLLPSTGGACHSVSTVHLDVNLSPL
jgi:hypothetical protein